MRLQYSSFAEAAEICTRVSPYRLLFSRRSWYVIGRSSLHRAVRTFNVGAFGCPCWTIIMPSRHGSGSIATWATPGT